MAQKVLHRTPLFKLHEEEGAKLVPFAGWEMPVEYAGILAEHEAVRTDAGLFDLSHMGELELAGPGTLPFVNQLVTNEVEALRVGQVCYTVMCRDDGGILDDLLVYRLPDRVFLVVNASNREKIAAWIAERLPAGVTMADRTFEIALLAVQGPRAEAILQPMVSEPLLPIPYYHGRAMTVLGAPALISRTGYTGEDGFEIYVAAERAEALWRGIRGAGVPPVGLGARDTLRLESCYALYGHEIDEETTPLEAGLSWVVRWKKPAFVGKEALLRRKEGGIPRTLVAFKMTERGIPRQGYPLKGPGGSNGIVTSGTFSPTLKIGVGMGYLPTEALTAGSEPEISVEVRGKECRGVVVPKPLYRGTVRSKK